uniref:Complement component C3 n=1 Tax=Sinonovacula constricta TaxID=98310 RepID=A0A1L2E170_SINCO|nr:complement component C3 [Sinonovacula constricta]
MKLVIWLIVLGLLIQSAASYFYVAAPNVIRYEHNETVVLGLFVEQNKDIEIWLEFEKGSPFSKQKLRVVSEEQPRETTVRVSQNDISDKWKRNPDFVTLVAKKDGEEKRLNVVLSYRTGHLIVQTDKPIYTPRQNVKVRVLAMTEQFSPANKMNVSVDIVSPKNITFARYFHQPNDWKNTELSYFFQHEFELPPLADTGIWTIKATFRGQYKTDGRALFAVQEYVLPTFGVSIETEPNYILPDGKESINITVHAEYVYKKPVKGTVELELSAVRSLTGDKEEIGTTRGNLLNNDGKYKITITRKQLRRDYPKACDHAEFPEGFRLQVLAKATEDATGNQETALDESIIFARSKYQVSFERSKSTYGQSMSYLLKVDVRYANSEVAGKKNLQVDLVYGNITKVTKNSTTNQDGQGTILFNELPENKEIEMRVRVYDCVECSVAGSASFQIKPFYGKKQIVVEKVETGGVEYLRANTNGNTNEDTGLLFMVVSNGHIIHTEFKPIGEKREIVLEQKINSKINSPTARLLAVYINKATGKLIADSEKFRNNIQCNGKEVSLKAQKTNVNTGDKSNLTIEGTPYMYVGLNIMDSALLRVTNRAQIISRQTMLDVMDEHDTGCGQGSGQTGEAVFRNTGLVILTDASTELDELERKGVSCGDIKNRRKRSIGKCRANKVCCEMAYIFTEDLIYDGDEIEDPYTTCMGKVNEIKDKQTSNGEMVWPTKCLIAFFETCVYALEEYLSPTDTEDIGKSLGTVNRYTAIMSKLKQAGLYKGENFLRTDFSESWMFDIMRLGKEGIHTLDLKYPDSVTTWLHQAIGISEDRGFCVAETVEVTAFRDFFLQVDLPYKAVRLEKMNIKATLFNYRQEEWPAQVFLDHSPNYCSNSGPDRPVMIEVNMKPNSAQTVTFPILPIKAGKFEVTLRVVAIKNITLKEMKKDGVKKHLYVENEGIEVKRLIQVCLDPMKQRNDCQNDVKVTNTSYSATDDNRQKQILFVDLTLPENHIPDTAKAVGRLFPSVMEDVVSVLVNGVENLFVEPMGCGEQTVLRLAPNVYAMEYLKNVGKVTNEIETKGHHFIQKGVQRLLTFRKSDASYAAWLHRPGSTWLTAFVAKVFCQARKVDHTVQGLLDNSLHESLNWILTQTNDDGSFFDHMAVIHREIVGQLTENDPSLTAFVVTALAECSHFNLPKAKQSLAKATDFLSKLDKNMLIQNPYLLALSTYALALSNHPNKHSFREMLMKTKNELKKTGYYWGSDDGPPASAATVETTSYALLSMLLFDDLATSAHIVRWLTAQRNAEGSFRTTQDTVVGLQALSTYSIKTYSPNVNLDIKVSNPGPNGTKGVDASIRATDSDVVSSMMVTSMMIPINKGKNEMIVSVVGTGTGMLTVDLRYNRPRRENEKCRFDVTDVISSPVDNQVNQQIAGKVGRKCNICGICEGDPQEPDYDNLDEAAPEVQSNFGRKRRNVQEPNAKKCITFEVGSLNGEKFGMSIVKFGLETSMEVEKKSVEELMNSTTVIDHFELPENGKGFVTFYLKEINSTKIEFTFILEDTLTGDPMDRQPATIEVYDYYNPDVKCWKHYSTSGTKFLDHQVQCQGTVCSCLQNLCPKDEQKTLVKLDYPVPKLAAYTCDFNKATFAVLLTVKSMEFNKESNMMEGMGVVEKVIHKGEENLAVKSEMTFTWRPECTYVTESFSVEGKSFYIIGPDGYQVDAKGNRKYVYDLMENALILKKPNNPSSKFAAIMSRFEAYMNKTGCTS